MKSRNLNFTYRLVWSNVKQMFIAVAEFARTRKKRCRTVVLAATLLTAPFTTLAQAQQLPTGGQIVAGQGHIASTGTTMIVTQNTANMAVNWQNFSIGQGNTVNFVQPSASAVALNRVLGSDVSVIQGALNANGKIFLINPNGALFTPTAQVNVGSLLASTLNISTADFMAGNYRFEGISSNAITNQGNITTTAGGTVALIAAKIVNSGQINAPQGNVLMAAGSKVTLDLGGPVKIQIDEGALNTLIEQGGGIRSDGGLVYLTAKAAGELATSVINHTGITEARTLATGGKGEIYLLADMKRGETIVSGKLDASAPQGGDGGFIETSAATVTVRDGVQVTTAAPYGKTGKWLIDPVNITIAASGGDVTGATLATALQTTNVTLDTSGTGACTGAACSALSGSDGDIFVKDNITVTGGTVDTTLTLKAERNIVIDAGKTLSRTGSYKLHTILWSDSDNSGSGYVFITDGSTISTNGGKIVMAGGLDDGANGGTAGDGIPDGYATSATANYSGVSIGRLNNAATAGTTIQSGGGDILIRGKSTATTGSGMGISFSHSGTLNAGTGTLTMEGISSSYHGIELSAWIDGAPSGSYLDINANAVNISGTTSNANYHGLAGSQLNSKYTRVTAGAGGISLYGENTANSNKGVEISLNATTTGGGDITAETPGLFSFYNGSNAHSINAGSGDIVIKSNTLNVGSNNTISGSGTLTVEPYAAGTTIGIAGGTGTLQLPASYFSTNFVNGFSGITVGNAAAGAITVGSTALSYNDPLTIKTGNSIFFGGTSSVSGNNNALTLWTRAGGNDAADDGIDGSVWIPVGASINTGGGNITIGGGTNPVTGYALGDNNSTSTENNARYRGVTVNGTLNAAGGSISILGRGNPSGTNARGVSIGGAISTSGSGTITISGIAKDGSDGLALGDVSVSGTTGTISSENGNITLTGTKDSGSNGVNLSTAASSITTSGTGSLAVTSTGNINGTGHLAIGGTTSLTAGNSNISLVNTDNDFTGAVSVVSSNNISLVDSNALTIGAVNASGTVDIATLTGNLTLSGAVTTTNATASAIALNAGKSAAAGTASGDNIIISGGSVNVGTGGTAKLYSGSVAGSTGLTSLVGSGSSHFRYNSDETAANYTTALTTGTHAIYREQPTVTVTAKDATQTAGGAGYSGGNGVTTSGFVNGDTAALALGDTLTYGGTSQGSTATGTYSITPGGYSSKLGYALAYVDGTLTITAAPSPSPTRTEQQQAAMQTAQALPTSNTPTPPGAPSNSQLTPQAPTPGASGGLEFVNVSTRNDGGVTPSALPPDGGAQTLAGNVRVFVEDGGIRLPTGNMRR